MKLAIFIPAYNEADTIGDVLASIPRHFRGIDEYKIFVADDGSTDGTAHEARKHGAQVIECAHRGLAATFKAGLDACLEWGADIIAHLDADGQYDPAEIGKVIEPILKGQAEMVTGDRQVEKRLFLGPARRYGNILGSWFLRAFAGVKVRDASSGFRAYNRAAVERLEVHSTHTYTHETLIEARFKGFRVAEVPVTFRPRGGNAVHNRRNDLSHNNSATPVKGANCCCGKKPDHPSASRLTRNLLKHIFKSLRGIWEAKARYGKKRR